MAKKTVDKSGYELLSYAYMATKKKNALSILRIAEQLYRFKGDKVFDTLYSAVLTAVVAENKKKRKTVKRL